MKRLLTLAIAVAFIFAGTSLAQPMNGGGKMMHKGDGMPKMRGQMIKERLELNDEQSKKFDEIMFAQREKAIDTRAEIQKLKLQAQKITSSGKVEVEKLKEINSKIADLQKEMKNARLDSWNKINKILTPEQQKIWAQMLDRIIAHKGKMGKGKRMRHRRMMMR